VSIPELIEGILDRPDVREYIDKHDVTVTGTGGMYTRKHKGFLPHLMERVYTDRSVWKNKMIEAQREYQKNPSKELEYEIAKCNNMQMAKKIQLNSAYGALANQYFRWFDNRYAESVTMSGQLSIRWIEKHMNRYLNEKLKTKDVDYVIACDTDSMYITLDKYVDQAIENKEIKPEGDMVSFLDDVAREKLEPFIDLCYKDLATYVNAIDQKMIMKREAIADKGIWTAKKHYVLSVHDMEGVRFKTPSLKVMGIEAVRSSTPAVCRSKIKEAIAEIMYQDEDKLINFVSSFRKLFYSLPFEDVAFPRGISNLDKYINGKSYKKGTPIHVRGAIVFNGMLDEYDLKGQYQEIFTGEKIKFCYLKLPNPARENVISVASALPKQFGIDKYIDYEKQFDKSFIEPMKTITDAIGWKLEKVVTLEDFWN
jgi:DNA polymerase elongation subunit (family B)